jgi:hypothetical protein
VASKDKIAKLYGILEEMVRYAQAGDQAEVSRLNDTYEALNPWALYRKMDPALADDYDNCRQSCTLIGIDWAVSRKKLLKDAKERFARIPRPKKLTTLSERARAYSSRGG